MRSTVEPQRLSGKQYADVTNHALLLLCVIVCVHTINCQRRAVGHLIKPTTHAIAGDDDTNDAMLIEADDQRSYLGFDEPIRMRSLVTRNWRMSVYQGAEWGEIYDLENDPDEMRNLWDEPSHASIRAELMEILARKQIELVDRSPFPTARA